MTSYTVINPANESEISSVELLDVEATDEAIATASVAQQAWAGVSPADKAQLLRRFAEAVDSDRERLAQIEVSNSGHPISQARWEAGHVRDVLTYYAASPERMFGKQIPVAGGIDVTFQEPLGVVGIITPWNFPMTIAAWGFAPALAAGNAVLLKPAEWTPLTSIRLGELALEAGLPEGLFQVLPGRGSVVGERFVTNPTVRKVVFTGSTEVGKKIMAGCAEQVKRVTLELGGKSANIVFADSDLEKAAATAPYGVFENAGQDCCARSRILVERSVYDRFMELLEPAVQGVKVGDPADEATEMGPLVSADGQHVEHALGRVGVTAVAAVDDRHVRAHVLGDEVRSTGVAVAHHEHIGGHGFQVAQGVEQGFALARRRGGHVQGDHVGRQALGRQLKGGAGAGRVLEEHVADGLAAQQRDFFHRPTADFEERVGRVEDFGEQFAGQAVEGQEVLQLALSIELQRALGI